AVDDRTHAGGGVRGADPDLPGRTLRRTARLHKPGCARPDHPARARRDRLRDLDRLRCLPAQPGARGPAARARRQGGDRRQRRHRRPHRHLGRAPVRRLDRRLRHLEHDHPQDPRHRRRPRRPRRLVARPMPASPRLASTAWAVGVVAALAACAAAWAPRPARRDRRQNQTGCGSRIGAGSLSRGRCRIEAHGLQSDISSNRPIGLTSPVVHGRNSAAGLYPENSRASAWAMTSRSVGGLSRVSIVDWTNGSLVSRYRATASSTSYSVRRSSTSSPRMAQYGPGCLWYGIPTLPGFTERTPWVTRSNWICACAVTRTRSATPTRALRMRRPGVAGVISSSPLRGEP